MVWIVALVLTAIAAGLATLVPETSPTVLPSARPVVHRGPVSSTRRPSSRAS